MRRVILTAATLALGLASAVVGPGRSPCCRRGGDPQGCRVVCRRVQPRGCEGFGGDVVARSRLHESVERRAGRRP